MFIHSVTNQGRRPYMEDEILHTDKENYWISAIFDGHGGGEASKFLKTYFSSVFQTNMNKTNNDFKRALIQSIQKINQQILRLTAAGSTANIVTYSKPRNKFFIANVGDSRAILREGNTTTPITRDHKPTDPVEKSMIQRRGGSVINGRVNGNLAVSRAVGDLDVAHIITAFPDVYEFAPSDTFRFILHASDGLYDVMSNAQIGEFICRYLDRKVPPKVILQQLVAHAIQIGSWDNISVSLILKHENN